MLKVKKEISAKRCEICHQSDRFDAEKNYCMRCLDIENLKKVDVQTTKGIYFSDKEKKQESVLWFTIKSIYVMIIGMVMALISAIIVPNLCSSHCNNIFHPFHLFLPIPMFFLGLFAGIGTIYKVKKDIISAIFTIISGTIISGLIGSIVGIFSILLSNIPKVSLYYSLNEKLQWGIWLGFETGTFFAFTFYLLITLIKLCKTK